MSGGAGDASRPKASVVVRSYKRPAALRELLAVLCAQSERDIEIIIVEQSDDPSLHAALRALDPRVVVLAAPPLGPAGARNVGVTAARGAILVLIDDDDLPCSSSWVAAHLANYEDPRCIGINGRYAANASGTHITKHPRLVRWLAFRLTVFRDTRTMATGPLRKEGIAYAMGSNVSLRQELLARAGGWDEGVPMGEELSFYFRLRAYLRPGEYLAYDPVPVIWRRMDIVGGLDRRGEDAAVAELMHRTLYYHHVVRTYFPWRYWLMWPLFLVRPLERTLFWIWRPSQRSGRLAARWRDTLRVVAAFPRALRHHGPFASPAIRRVPRLPTLDSEKTSAPR